MTASPDFDTPQRTVPFLKAVSPNLYQIPRQRPREAQLRHQLAFEILSEDLNQTTPLSGLVMLDFPGFQKTAQDNFDNFKNVISIPPGHLLPPSGGPREVETDFAFPPGILGCHSISVIVSHQFKNPLTLEPSTPGDIAILTWWYLLISDTGELPADATQCVSAPDRDDGGTDGEAVFP